MLFRSIKEMNKLGISDFIEETSVGQVDYRKFQCKNKVKTTLQEQQQARAGLEAFRRWTEENMSIKEISK